MTNPPALNTHVLTYTPVRQVHQEQSAATIRRNVSCTAAANTRSAYRKQADRDKSKSKQARGTQRLPSSEDDSHQPGCMFVLLNMKQLHSLTQATRLPSLTFEVKKFLSFPCFPLLREKKTSVASPGGIRCLLSPGRLLWCVDSKMRGKLMKLHLDE